MPVLARDYRVLAPEMVGYGASRGPPTSVSVWPPGPARPSDGTARPSASPCSSAPGPGHQCCD